MRRSTVLSHSLQLVYPDTRLENLARDKHSSLLRKFVNRGQKVLYNIWLAVANTIKLFCFVTISRCSTHARTCKR
jgi:hypothetical protein